MEGNIWHLEAIGEGVFWVWGGGFFFQLGEVKVEMETGANAETKTDTQTET